MNQHIAMIGFGEAAEAFATGSGAELGPSIRAWDIALDDPATADRPRARAARCGARLKSSRAEALAGAGLVWCLVTADQAVAAAQEAAPHLDPGALWMDGNSCSPGAKRRAAEAIEAAGGRYVDVAIMAPVHPRLHRTPLLVAGPHAAEAADALASLGMQAGFAGDRVGQASTIKMLRSVMIKGMEALTAECLLAARKTGLDGQVLASLAASNPATDWQAQSAYNLDRMMVHGIRRAAEMREVAATLSELDLPSGLAAATADWQDRIGTLRLDPGKADFGQRADAILAALQSSAAD